MAEHTDRDGTSGGPTLYLESSELDSSEAFCTAVFGDASGEYRVVQLTSTRSFDSLHDALDVQLEKIRHPSEAAVILLSPVSADDETTAAVGDDVPLYGYWVDPQDLTGISVAFSRLLEQWEDTQGTVRICLRDVESLLPYHDVELVYRFLNTVLATLQGAGAEVHAHFRPAVADDRALQMIASLFDRVVESEEARSAEAPPEGDVDAEVGTPSRDEEAPEAPPTDSTSVESVETGSTTAEFTANATMSSDEIDAFLDSMGYGVLAFDGSPPYAVPMSYGYDPDEQVLYMQLSEFADSEKQARLAASNDVTFVVARYGRPDRWRSVVVDGALRPIPEDDVREGAALDAFGDSDLASLDVFGEDLAELTFSWYVLETSTFSGRQSVDAR